MSSYIHGRRRRRVQVHRTGPAASAAAANPVQPPRPILAKNFRLPVQPARVMILRCVPYNAAFQGAHPFVLVGQIPRQRKTAQPIIRSTRPLPNIPPPTQRWQPRPQIIPDYTRQGRWRPLLVRTQSGRLPSPAMPAPAIVGRWRPGPPAIRPRLYRTSLAQASVNVIPRPTVQRLPIIPWRVRPVLIQRTHPQSTARPVPRVILPTARPRPALPWRNYQVSVRTLRIYQPPPPRPGIIPLPRQPVRTPPVKVHAKAGSILWQQTKPLIVSRPVLRIWPRPVWPAARYQLASPALHNPLPRSVIVSRPRLADARQFAQYKTLSGQTAYPTWGQNAVNPPAAGSSATPPDLIAALVVWIRQNSALVAAFGDSATTPKFGSDLAAPKTAYPYCNFFEPDEDESYETEDQTGLVSSVADGTLGLEVVGSGKLAVRQLGEQLAAAINNAPLTFADGNLIHLYRSTRKFPTFRETGPGTNVVTFKRYLEFDYKIERWAPVL